MNINDLGEVCLESIFVHLSPYDDLHNCRLVCSLWNIASISAMKKLKRDFKSSVSRQQLQCKEIPVAQHSITPRFSHSSCIFEGYMYVFGGCTKEKTLFNDVWKLS